MKPRPSSSTNSGIVGDFSEHEPLSAGDAVVCQHRATESSSGTGGKQDDLLYIFVGQGHGFKQALESGGRWVAWSLGWPLAATTVQELSDLIKRQGCAFFHCDLDVACGREVMAAAFKLARLQRRAGHPFHVVLPEE